MRENPNIFSKGTQASTPLYEYQHYPRHITKPHQVVSCEGHKRESEHTESTSTSLHEVGRQHFHRSNPSQFPPEHGQGAIDGCVTHVILSTGLNQLESRNTPCCALKMSRRRLSSPRVHISLLTPGVFTYTSVVPGYRTLRAGARQPHLHDDYRRPPPRHPEVHHNRTNLILPSPSHPYLRANHGQGLALRRIHLAGHNRRT